MTDVEDPSLKEI